MRLRGSMLFPVGFAAVLAGCASMGAGERATQSQADYAAAAGAPVRRFHLYDPLWSWVALGERQVVLYTRPDQAWLLDLGPCPNLPYASAIAVTSDLHEVAVGYDQILVGGSFPPCRITAMRLVDLARLRHDRKARRPVGERPRSSTP